jgi:hypothetical protein
MQGKKRSMQLCFASPKAKLLFYRLRLAQQRSKKTKASPSARQAELHACLALFLSPKACFAA